MKTSWMLGWSLGCLTIGCGSVQDVQSGSMPSSEAYAATPGEQDDEDGEDEQEIALDQVPEAVKKAAEAAVPGFVLERAEKETEDGSLVYCLEGQAGVESVEIEVRASDATVVEIERGEDEEDDQDD